MKFLELEKIPKAYSCIRYVGTKTAHGTTDFSKLGLCVSDLLKDNSVRASRPLHVIYSALEVSVMLSFLCLCLCAILCDAGDCCTIYDVLLASLYSSKPQLQTLSSV